MIWKQQSRGLISKFMILVAKLIFLLTLFDDATGLILETEPAPQFESIRSRIETKVSTNSKHSSTTRAPVGIIGSQRL